MKTRSNKFYPGQVLEGTLLTVKDSVRPDSWDAVICVCVCGTELVLPYAQAYYRSRYSCGCAQRLRSNAADATGAVARNGLGNFREGRELTILYRDPDTTEWIYLCSCCGETYAIPRGGARGPQAELLRIAGLACPNWRGRFTPVEKLVWFKQELNPNTNQLCPGYDPDSHYIWPRELTGSYADHQSGAICIAPYFQPDSIVRNREGNITGFFGWPSQHVVNPDAFKDWTRWHWERQARHVKERAQEDAARNERIDKRNKERVLIPVDPDGFGALAVYEPAPEALEYDQRRAQEDEKARLAEEKAEKAARRAEREAIQKGAVESTESIL